MIFCFSGTGNSRYIARRIGERTGDRVAELPVTDTGPCACGDDALVFVTPTYAWRLPRVAEAWIRGANLAGKRAWFVMSCGTDVGAAGKYLERMCRETSIVYMGLMPIVMPENYIVMFKAPEQAEAQKIISRAIRDMDHAAERICAGAPFDGRKANIMDRIKSGPVNRAFYPLYVHARGFRAGDTCVGCGVCETACPLHNVRMENGRPKWGGSCTQCMACLCRCPKGAIECGRGTRGKRRYVCPEYKPEKA